MDIKRVLDSGDVLRYHAALLDKQQLNSSHQWEATVILVYIYPQATARLMFHVLTHDTAEAITGDLPAPIKRKFPDIRETFSKMEHEIHMELDLPVDGEFSKEELIAAKYADILSGLYFTTQRVNRGDRTAIPIRDNWLKYLGSMPYLNDNIPKLVEIING